VLVVVGLFSGIGAYIQTRSQAAAIPNGTYSEYTWPSPAGGLNNMQHDLIIEQVGPNAPYFWAHSAYFINGGSLYIGLQSNGNRIDKSVGRTVVFSIFDAAIYGSPGRCQVIKKDFDGYTGRVGTSCRV